MHVWMCVCVYAWMCASYLTPLKRCVVALRGQYSGNPHGGGMGKLKMLLKRRDDSGRNGRMAAVIKRDTLKQNEWHGDKCMR